ncbi:hypothetical protein ACN38_g7750 [Penicillium nordicum]|uniref:Uncharacterized protein n=1 Tax=Penicillium nordicum TaxID=229535 RepID=A0A0M8P134_9EURO|nr:hypothetical protein ACN38_g7750 [Penicillium nordicum]
MRSVGSGPQSFPTGQRFSEEAIRCQRERERERERERGKIDSYRSPERATYLGGQPNITAWAVRCLHNS